MPGSGKQSTEIQQQIIEFLNAGIDPTTIHRRLKVGRSSIYRMKRSLQQHGTAYAPPETNKKNGRPKVMTTDQENQIRDWLKDPKNRERYLDDMVWFIHDRFGMVCSTTTCSKIKRKWLKVIDAEERGEYLDPAVAQEQVREEAFRVGKKPTGPRKPKNPPQQEPELDEAHAQLGMLTQQGMRMPNPYGLSIGLGMQQPLPEREMHIDQHLQEQLQSEVAHAALHQSEF